MKSHAARGWFALALAAVAAPLGAATIEVGQPAPALVVPELGGTTFDLMQQRGKVVIVNFWATWCEPCRQEAPILEEFYKAQHDNGLEIVGISLNRSRERDAVRKAVQSVTYPVAIAAEASSNGFGVVRLLPVTYVIDREGIVRARLAPATPVTMQRLEETVAPLLGHRDSNTTP
ncbi:MAG TPA: TlpA disulfide reductase family protein [Thermoanaerobaculia bacterium]|nr:TlpA disulfide reductase family protein [Thermoanaerobaculia bacterium]